MKGSIDERGRARHTGVVARWLWLLCFLAVVILLVAYVMNSTSGAEDALRAKRVAELGSFTQWLSDNDAKGYVGEMGWPAGDDESARAWSKLAQAWYEEATAANLMTSIWATGSYWGEYPLCAYCSISGGGGGLSVTKSQGSVSDIFIKKAPNLHGVTLAGAEFGSITASSRGVVGRDYFYEPEGSYAYLASKGVRTLRLPLRWERVQPTLGGSFSSLELEKIHQALTFSNKYGIKVIIDLHNYGGYMTHSGWRTVGDGLERDLVEFWRTFAEKFKEEPALLGYGIMNEPHDTALDGSTKDVSKGARGWEGVAQQVVDAIRDVDRSSVIFVPGYDWSSLVRFKELHPQAWIKDPSDNVRYEVHHYWDYQERGKYGESYNVVKKREV